MHTIAHSCTAGNALYVIVGPLASVMCILNMDISVPEDVKNFRSTEQATTCVDKKLGDLN